MTHLYRDTAVVLRTYKLGEADRIVVLLTEDHGKVRAVATGVRKTTSRFGARLEPMSHVRLLLYRGRELDIVSQAESVEPLSPLLASLDRAPQALGVLEAADQLALEREPNPQLYRMIVGVLRTIAERASPLVVPAFCWKLLAAEGLQPEFDACVRCGAAEPHATLVSFASPRAGCCAGPADRERRSAGPRSGCCVTRWAGGSTRRSLCPSRRRPTRWGCWRPGRSSTTSSAGCARS